MHTQQQARSQVQAAAPGLSTWGPILTQDIPPAGTGPAAGFIQPPGSVFIPSPSPLIPRVTWIQLHSPTFFSISCCFIPSATLATIADLPNFFPHVISTALTSAASALSTTFVSDLPTLGIWYAISRSRLHPASPLCLVCASLPKNS